MMKTLAGSHLVAATALLFTSSIHAAPINVYSNDFDGNEVFSSGITGGFSGITTLEVINTLNPLDAPAGFAGNMLVNQSGSRTVTPSKTTLTLNNLPTHDSIDINFLLMFINSWDGIGGSFGQGPNPDGTPKALNDKLLLDVDGVNILDISADNGDMFVDYDGTLAGNGTHILVNGGQIFANMHSSPDARDDSAYDMGTEDLLTITHTASTLTIDIYAGGPGWQGGPDEYWGIEAMQVTVNEVVVPVPPALWLFGSGLFTLIGITRRTRPKPYT